jgi:uncharacterized protein (UPF0264 family)
MSLQDVLKNCSTVHRLYGNDYATELVGIFQYSSDAEDFAKWSVERDAGKDYKARKYIVHCTYSGKCRVFSVEPPLKVQV